MIRNVKCVSRFATMIVIAAIAFACGNSDNKYHENRLWYTHPAEYWNSQSLHLGNGYFGASFFGGVQKEVFALSEKSMWTGGPYRGDWEETGVNPDARESLPSIRKAITNGDIRNADSMVQHHFLGSSSRFGTFTSIGKLILTFHHPQETEQEYIRELDLSESLGRVAYRMGMNRYTREYFCSYPDRVLVVKLDTRTPGTLSFTLGMDIMHDSTVTEIHGNRYQLTGYIDGNLHPFHLLIHVDNRGGEISEGNTELRVSNANSVVIYLTAATAHKLQYPGYSGEYPQKITRAVMKNVLKRDFEEVRDRHLADYRSLYDRVQLTLEGKKGIGNLPTDERWKRMKSGEVDPGLKVLAFNLGRYMIISSSRPGTLPANLQGVWNNFKRSPWNGNYQSNINLQLIYMPTGPVNLIECQEPYIDWIEDLSLPGKEIARLCYGTGGWVSHTTGNIWGHAAPRGSLRWGMFPAGAAWHCQHVWEQFAFTQDTAYLKNRAYSLLKGASDFWLENLIPYKESLISAPSVSAEHGAYITLDPISPAYREPVPENYACNIPGTYQDIEMIWDLFTNTAEAARIIGDDSYADSLMKTRQSLLPLQIGRHGQLQEWYPDIDDPECHHRHIAHMYAVCPGRQIHPLTTPELADAARKTLNMRGEGRFPGLWASGGNWSMAFRSWCWTRLMDGNRANEVFTQMLTAEGFENLLTFQHAGYDWGRPEHYMEGDTLACHFQLDGSAAVAGIMAEMLMQSHMGEIHLMPALPDEMKTGRVIGLQARGGYTVDMEWEEKELVHATIRSRYGAVPRVRYKKELINPEKDPRIKLQ